MEMLFHLTLINLSFNVVCVCVCCIYKYCVPMSLVLWRHFLKGKAGWPLPQFWEDLLPIQLLFINPSFLGEKPLQPQEIVCPSLWLSSLIQQLRHCCDCGPRLSAVS